MRFICIALAILVAIPGIASAQTHLRCEMVPTRSTWVGDVVLVRLESTGKAALVADKVSLQFNGQKPVTAKVTKVGSKSLRLRWTFKASDALNRTTTVKYTARYSTDSGKIRIDMVPLGFESPPLRHQGACAPVGPQDWDPNAVS